MSMGSSAWPQPHSEGDDSSVKRWKKTRVQTQEGLVPAAEEEVVRPGAVAVSGPRARTTRSDDDYDSRDSESDSSQEGPVLLDATLVDVRAEYEHVRQEARTEARREIVQDSVRAQVVIELKRPCWHWGLLAAVFVIVAVGVAVAASLLGGRSSNTSPSTADLSESSVPTLSPSEMPSNIPTMAPSRTPSQSPTTVLYGHVLEQAFLVTSSLEILSNPVTPQSRALHWMIHEDQSSLEYPIRDSFNQTRFQQRYIMAVLGFATTYESWALADEYLLASVHECNWYGVGRCNRQKEIIDVTFGKYVLG